ncbi:rCG51664 [Rattus norvegicus]|uniref:RCG51664 n=1 Tax=Rattus norvegicus TaxID=10116 RepID=A6IZ02_RAT|nr:rCG51664 [Rattus norvegicus]
MLLSTPPHRGDTSLHLENFLELLRRSWVLCSLWAAMRMAAVLMTS